MNFSEEQTYKVHLSHPEFGDLGEATLTFGGEKPVVAMIGLRGAKPVLDGLSLELVHAKTEEGHAFTLFDCRVQTLYLSATYIMFGLVDKNRFTKFDVRYSDISEWFLRWQRIDGDVGKTLSWTRLAKHFSVDANDGTKQFSLSSRHVGTRNQVGEDLVVHEHVEFRFESQNAGFSAEDIREKAIELCSLFSISTAYPISIVSVEVSTGDEWFRSLYFGTFKQLPRDNGREFLHQCFLQKSSFEERWQSVLQNFFRNKELRDLWVRLAGMRRYEGFWEFKLLGYVSLLNRCVIQRSSALRASPKRPKSRKLSRLAGRLQKLSVNLDTAEIRQIVEIASETFSQRNSLSFDDHYAYAMEATDAAVRAVIELTDESFELIKDVRDKVAHGDSPGLRGDDYTKISITVAKICLLLTYWALFDIGLPTDEFLGALNTTASSLRFEAMPNQKNLDRITKAAEFFSVSGGKYIDLVTQKRHAFVCFIEGPPGNIEFSQYYTKVCNDAFNSPASRPQGRLYWDKILNVAKEAVRYVPKIYVESGERTLELHSVCILEKSRLPAAPM